MKHSLDTEKLKEIYLEKIKKIMKSDPQKTYSKEDVVQVLDATMDGIISAVEEFYEHR